MLPKEFSWFLMHPEISVQYAGEYIAIIGEAVVSHGKNFKKVLDEAEKYGKEPFVHKILPINTEAKTYRRNQQRQAERALMRENYLRKRIEEGATNAELQKLLEEMDRIEEAYAANPEQARQKANQLGIQKRKAWCEQKGIPNDPSDDLAISDLIVEAVKQVRNEQSK